VTMQEENLSFHQASILQYLKENPDKDIYQKYIEHLFSIKRSTNQMLRSLEARQLIKRTPDHEDARN
jgi:DNA-binding MarR family transcriptional regulator